MKAYSNTMNVLLASLLCAILISIGPCTGAEGDRPFQGTGDRPYQEKLKSPGLNEALESCLADFSKADKELQSLQGEGKMVPHPPGGGNPFWSDYLERSNVVFHALFYSQTGPIRHFAKDVLAETQDHHELYELGYEIDYGTNGLVEHYRRRDGHQSLYFFPNGGLKSIWIDLDERTTGQAFWDTDGKLKSEGVSSHPPRNAKSLVEYETALREGDMQKKLEAVRAMVAIGAPSIPYALNVLRDGDELSREQAASMFGLLGRRSALAVPDLIRLLKQDKSAAVRKSIVRSLGLIGPPAAAAVPALEEIATQDSGDLTNMAKAALQRIRRSTAK